MQVNITKFNAFIFLQNYRLKRERFHIFRNKYKVIEVIEEDNIKLLKLTYSAINYCRY